MFGVSQNINSFTKANPNKAIRTYSDAGTTNSSTPFNKSKSGMKGISSVPITSSGNVYGFLLENQTCLVASEAIGVLHFTSRGNPPTIGASSGDIISSQSRDGGWNWTQMNVFPNASGANNRYPSGVIYNPSTKNTNPDNAYAVCVGPVSDGSGWPSSFWGSMRLDSTNASREYKPTYGALIRSNLTATANGKFHIISSNYSATPYFLDTLLLFEGTWNNTNNKVDWVENKLYHDFVIGSDGSQFAYVWDFKTAWSEDGVTGYYWTIGRDSSNDTRSYQPIVWKTVNSGSTWTKMPVYDFSNLTTITDELRTMGGLTTKRPQFTGVIEGVVDANGNLHLMSRISSAYSNNNDSLDYSFTQTFEGLAGHNTIFDVYTTSTGWAAHKLGRVWTIDVADADSQFGSGADAIGWDCRLQAGRTTDGTKVFASWADSDTSFALTNATGFPMNTFPDIIFAGVNITTNTVIPEVNYTAGTGLAGDCFFHYMSNIILTDINGNYTIPFAELDLGSTPLDPVTVNYVKFSGNSIAENNPSLATISQNRPNPFSGITSIEVTLSDASEISIIVTNVTGQKVYEMNYGKELAGLHNYQINASNLSSGLYFYTVKAGNTSSTKKMIVR
ncbi:MAG: hypothetical protein AUJ98_02720 [Bacteroidetes bacterium CG2_30_33_31]|nr:MAG: hypothetical protein AUJ98_02720 [Bacteroidetes bacterium CG2_30_33_31]